MHLKVKSRTNRPGFQIIGTIPGLERIRRTASARTRALAVEEAVALESRLLRERFHGRPESRGDRLFAEIAAAYVRHQPREQYNIDRIAAISRALGPAAIARDIDQERIDRLVGEVIRKPAPSPNTVRAFVVTPLRAVLNFAFKRKWCDKPVFDLPKLPPGRTDYFLPCEAERMVAAAAPHLQPLLVFLFGTGGRLGESLSLDWREVDLVGGRAIFLAEKTKTRRRRVAHLPPAVVAALAEMPERDGAVFRWVDRAGHAHAYKPREGYGGQIKTAWHAALGRAGLNPELTPHSTRHSWASWHYAINRDPYLLMREGGWENESMVRRYAHLMPAGHDAAIASMWGAAAPAAAVWHQAGTNAAAI
jgi:integrase